MTHTGCLLATSDNEVAKIGPSPKGCGEESGHTSLSPSTLEPPKPSGYASSPPRSGPIFASRVPGARFCAMGLNAAHES